MGRPSSLSAAAQRWARLSTSSVLPVRVDEQEGRALPVGQRRARSGPSMRLAWATRRARSRRRSSGPVLRVKAPGRAWASAQCSAPPRTPQSAHIGGYFLRGKRWAKSSAISSMVTNLTPGCEIMWW